MTRKSNNVDKTGIRNRRKSPDTLLVAAMGLTMVMFAGLSGYGWALDYGSAGAWNNRSGGGQHSDYTTRWARDTKPWSREFSGGGAWSGGADAANSTGYNQWAGEPSGGRQDWQGIQAPYGNNGAWQSQGWYQNQPNNVSQGAESTWESQTQRSDPNRQVSGPQQNDWGELRESGPWPDSQPVPGRRDDGPWSGNRDNGRKNPSGARRATSWDDWSSLSDSRSPRDYSTRGTLSSVQNSWEKDPWSRNPSENPRSGYRARPSDANSYGGQTSWGRERSNYQNNPSRENRPWGTSRRMEKVPSEQQPKSTPYAPPLPDGGQSGYLEYPSEYPDYSGYAAPYSGMGGFGAAYGSGYGYGHKIRGPEYPYGSKGAYPGLGNVPTVGDLLGFPF